MQGKSRAHISLDENNRAFQDLFAFRPESAMPVCELAEVLLHTPGTLSMAELLAVRIDNFANHASEM
jgi:hypothetical protein